MKQITMSLLASTAILFTACGGGGGDAAAVPNTNQYDLRTFIDTVSYTVSGAGTLTIAGTSYDLSGTMQTTYQGTDEPIAGVIVHLHDATMILNANNIQVVQSANSATYMGNLVYVDNTTAGITCGTPLEPNAITPVPTDAQVGYISDVIPLECSDGTYQTIVMKLNDAGGDNAELAIISNTYSSQGGTLQDSQTTYVVVTPNMSMVNVELSGSVPSESATYTLNSTSITQN